MEGLLSTAPTQSSFYQKSFVYLFLKRIQAAINYKCYNKKNNFITTQEKLLFRSQGWGNITARIWFQSHSEFTLDHFPQRQKAFSTIAICHLVGGKAKIAI